MFPQTFNSLNVFGDNSLIICPFSSSLLMDSSFFYLFLSHFDKTFSSGKVHPFHQIPYILPCSFFLVYFSNVKLFCACYYKLFSLQLLFIWISLFSLLDFQKDEFIFFFFQRNSSWIQFYSFMQLLNFCLYLYFCPI